jgi:hypothetical protein
VARREDVNIKFGPITDENLASALRHHGAEDIDIARMADELTQRRAADLTSKEREALEWARVVLDAPDFMVHQQHDPAVREHIAKVRRALAALDKLLGDGEGT